MSPAALPPDEPLWGRLAWKWRQLELKPLYGIKLFELAFFYIGVEVLFYQHNGLHQTQIGLLQSISAVTAMVMMVITGALADEFGRRRTIIIGALVAGAAYAGFGLGHGFWAFAGATVLASTGKSCITGADSSLAYDAYAELGRLHDYHRKFERRALALNAAGEATAAFAGGLIAIASLRATMWAQIGVFGLIAVLGRCLHEPPATAVSQHRQPPNIPAAVRRIGRAARAVAGRPGARHVIMFSVVLETMTMTMGPLTQPYYELVRWPTSLFGLAWALQMLWLFGASLLALRYSERLNWSNAYLPFLGLGVASYLLLAAFPTQPTMLAILGFYTVRAVTGPMVRPALSDQDLPGELHATIFSVQVLVQRLLAAGLSPVFGYLTDHYGLRSALVASACVYGLLGSVAYARTRRPQSHF